jgi:pimeloyl-ACP methyl ester carboxylesterase
LEDAVDHVEIAGLRIAYRQAGSGPPLLLLHSAFSDSREWRKQIDDLSNEFTVVAWDAPGCGQSSDPPETYELSDYADCLAGFIEALGLQRPHVAGLSGGSIYALVLYRWYPEIPRSLVLASAYAGWAGSLPPELVEQRIQQTLRDLEQPPEELIAGVVSSSFTESVAPDVVEEATRIIADFHPEGVRAMLPAFSRADLRDVLPRIDVPVLLLYGDADQRSPVSVGEEMHVQIPRSRLVVMPGVGHASNMEAPERFNAEVRAFLCSVP